MRIAMIFAPVTMPVLALLMVLALPVAAPAQDREQTLADIRQDLSLLSFEMKRLRRELSTTGGSEVAIGGETAIDRINAIEAELQRLTRKTEEMEHRINRIVDDGTNRIGDLEFRLVELEGGDVSQLGETSTLGGDMAAMTAPTVGLTPVPLPVPGQQVDPGAVAQIGPELAENERAEFDAAQAALESGNYAEAEKLFTAFNENYPGGPLGPQAALGRGRALESMGDRKSAARAYLEAYSMAPNGDRAAEALLELGRSLGALGQNEAACQTLAQIEARFPDSGQVTSAQTEMKTLYCQ